MLFPTSEGRLVNLESGSRVFSTGQVDQFCKKYNVDTEAARGFKNVMMKRFDRDGYDTQRDLAYLVAEAPWSVAEWAVAPRFDHPRAIVLVLLLG